MTSNIDPTKPTEGVALTADVRQNFQYAKDEIELLQTKGIYVNNSVAPGARITLTNQTRVDLVSIDLGVGDWDVVGAAYFQSTTFSSNMEVRSWINTVAVTEPDGTNGGLATNSTASAGMVTSLTIPPTRLNISVVTTVYLGVYADADQGTVTAHGFMAARRMG